MNVIPKLTNYKFSQIKLLQQKYIQANDLVRKILPTLNYMKLKQFVENELPVKFLIVRHPFDRLLSAYRDKFEVFKNYQMQRGIQLGRILIRPYYDFFYQGNLAQIPIFHGGIKS